MSGLEHIHSLEQQGLEISNKDPKRYTSATLTAKNLFEFIYLYESVIPKLNPIKATLDSACKANDTELFTSALNDFSHIAHTTLWELKTKLKSRRKQPRFKIHSELFLNTLNKISFIENTITGGKRWLKESQMSPKQLNAAKNASLRMKMAWGL